MASAVSCYVVMCNIIVLIHSTVPGCAVGNEEAKKRATSSSHPENSGPENVLVLAIITVQYFSYFITVQYFGVHSRPTPGVFYTYFSIATPTTISDVAWGLVIIGLRLPGPSLYEWQIYRLITKWHLRFPVFRSRELLFFGFPLQLPLQPRELRHLLPCWLQCVGAI